jgi:3-oxoacyl-[acyl-carrier protein] reductase
MRLDNKVAIVTGSAQGLGKAMVLKLAQSGAKIVVTDINYEACLKVEKEIKVAGGEAFSVNCNVTSRTEVKDLIAKTISRYGQIDILINNAGITKDAQITKMTDEQWDSVLETDLKSMFICIQEVLVEMIPHGSGKIINITSIAGEEGNFGQTNYSAAKAGVIGMTKTLSKELGKRGITVNAVAPGFILTEMTDSIPEKIKQQLIGRIPLKRGGKPEEVADAVLFLASDQASFITGHVLNVNGGMYV